MTILIISGLTLGFLISFLFVLFFRFSKRIQKRYLGFLYIMYFFGIVISAIILTNFIEGLKIFGIIAKKERTIFLLLWVVPSVITSVLSIFKFLKVKTVDEGQGSTKT
ncbi:MAG: hypothetical protein SCALA701_24370 [Candidatus Scalindua sp.]|nr:MAG: hypothetical protein DWQ00_13755 [Candidatus Scalindua sp.]GJQ59636.1 MAG: hypothetical protein SCALA701_24370 [Candidatus Scalindua sp.]